MKFRILFLVLFALLPVSGAAAHSLAGCEGAISISASAHADSDAGDAGTGDSATPMPPSAKVGGCAHCASCCFSPLAPMSAQHLPPLLGDERVPGVRAASPPAPRADNPYKPPRV